MLLRALLLQDAGQLDEAKREMDRAVRLAPKAGLIQLDAAGVHRAAGDTEGAAALEARSAELLGQLFEAAKKALAR